MPPTSTIPECDPRSNPQVFIQLGQYTELASEVTLCVSGTAPRLPTQLIVALPNGTTRSVTVDTFNYHGSPSYTWAVMPSDPVGVYKVTANLGVRRVTATFTVRAPKEPRLVVLSPDFGPPGTTFRLALAGFAPRSSVGLSVYVAEWESLEMKLTYLTDIGPAPTDSEGKTVYNFRTHPDDPLGIYCITFQGRAPYSCPDFFSLRR